MSSDWLPARAQLITYAKHKIVPPELLFSEPLNRIRLYVCSCRRRPTAHQGFPKISPLIFSHRLFDRPLFQRDRDLSRITAIFKIASSRSSKASRWHWMHDPMAQWKNFVQQYKSITSNCRVPRDNPQNPHETIISTIALIFVSKNCL